MDIKSKLQSLQAAMLYCQEEFHQKNVKKNFIERTIQKIFGEGVSTQDWLE